MAVHQETGTHFERRIDQLVTGLDVVRQEYGVDVDGRYKDDGSEDGPGAFFIVTDASLDYFTKDAFNRARREQYDDVRRRLEEDGVSDETYDAFMDLYEQEFDDGELDILGDTYLDGVDPEEIDEQEFYDRIYRTFDENDGAAVYGSDGFSDVTYDVPKLDFDGTANGTKEATARGVVENPLYTPDGEQMDVRAITLSETDGTIKVYGPDGFAEYGKNTPVPTREQDETVEESIRSDGGVVLQELTMQTQEYR